MYNILWMEEVFVLLATSTSGCTPKQYDYKKVPTNIYSSEQPLKKNSIRGG